MKSLIGFVGVAFVLGVWSIVEIGVWFCEHVTIGWR